MEMNFCTHQTWTQDAYLAESIPAYWINQIRNVPAHIFSWEAERQDMHVWESLDGSLGYGTLGFEMGDDASWKA